MDEYTDATYGDRIADVYDDVYGDLPYAGPIETTVEFLRRLAGGGPALELGIGTGRVALPLAESGVALRGIDASEAIVAKLRAKPGGADLPVTLRSFADFVIDERFSLIYVVFNTFFALRSQDEQVACFRAVARHLREEGVFVMEAFVPDLARYRQGSSSARPTSVPTRSGSMSPSSTTPSSASRPSTS
jgi:SAM-dependent methyltransferase